MLPPGGRCRRGARNSRPSNATCSDVIARKRAETADLALQIVAILNGEHAYEDLYLYRTEVAPQADDLLQRLAGLASLQQAQLGNSLERARLSLASVRLAAGVAGVLAVALALALAYAFRRSVVVPAASPDPAWPNASRRATCPRVRRSIRATRSACWPAASTR